MILKRTVLLLSIIFAAAPTHAQTANQTYESYLDFNLERAEGRNANALKLGEQLMPNAAKLTDKARISFYYSMGNLYEDDRQSVKAISLYEQVAAAVPNYYVVQRALGYLYGNKVDELSKKLNASKPNTQENKQLYELYIAAVKKALPYLEKAQACDPTNETLALIKRFYKYMKDEQALNSLDTRLAALSKNCVDLLSDQ